MSDKIKSNVSNEEVIEELTKYLEFSLQTREDNFVVNPNTYDKKKSSENVSKESEASNPYNDETELDNKYEESDKESDNDSIDETSLKDAELDLTDDEKAERQLIAEELKKVSNDA